VSTLTDIITRLFDLLVSPLGANRTAGLIVLSLIMGASLTLLYRATSDARRIRRTRDAFKARVLEMRIYPDDVVLIARALAGAMAAQGMYLRAAARPIFIVLVAAIPFFVQIEARYARAPLAPGSSTLVTASLKPGLDVRGVPTALSPGSKAGAGLHVDPRSVRAPAAREVTWRVIVGPGQNPLELRVYDQPYRFEVSAQNSGRAIGVERRARSLAGSLTDVGLPAIGRDSALDGVRVAYPSARYAVFGMTTSWLAVFLCATFAGAMIPALLLRVAL
jgi:hypothetical protein